MNINFPRVTGVIKPEKIYNNQKEKHRSKKDDTLSNKSKKKKHANINSNEFCDDTESSKKIKLDDYA